MDSSSAIQKNDEIINDENVNEKSNSVIHKSKNNLFNFPRLPMSSISTNRVSDNTIQSMSSDLNNNPKYNNRENHSNQSLSEKLILSTTPTCNSSIKSKNLAITTKNLLSDKKDFLNNIRSKINNSNNNNNTEKDEVSPESSSSSSSPKKRISANRVIRYSETIESLFCLHGKTTNDHKQLCHDVAYGAKVNDSSSWLIILNEATNYISSIIVNVTNNDENNEYRHQLLRLHKRATSRINLSKINDENDNPKNILLIWLSYAYAMCNYGDTKKKRNVDDVNQIYKLIWNHCCNNAKCNTYAELYVETSKIEMIINNNVDSAKEYLHIGLMNNALPTESIQLALQGLDDNDKNIRFSRNVNNENRQLSPTSSSSYSASEQSSFLYSKKGLSIRDRTVSKDNCSNNSMNNDYIITNQKHDHIDNNQLSYDKSKSKVNEIDNHNNFNLSSFPKIPSICSLYKSDDSKKTNSHIVTSTSLEHHKCSKNINAETKAMSKPVQVILDNTNDFPHLVSNESNDIVSSTSYDEAKLNEAAVKNKHKILFSASSSSTTPSLGPLPSFPPLRSGLDFDKKCSNEMTKKVETKAEFIHNKENDEIYSTENKENSVTNSSSLTNEISNTRSNLINRKRALSERNTNTKVDISDNNKYQSTLLRKKSRLLSIAKPVRLMGGKAERVSAQNNSCNSEEKNPIDETRTNSSYSAEDIPLSLTHQDNSDSPKSSETNKISKTDLSYLLSWEPQRKFNGSQQSDSISNTTKLHKSNYIPHMEVIVEETPSQGHSVTGNLIQSSAKRQSVGDSSLLGRRESNGSGTKELTPSKLKKGRDSASPSLDGTDLSRSNLDFLPVVAEENMLHVNGKSYAKLGVIGKGGSCKVYRALSKDCTVLAIKKVKLNGMDKKAIDGYANEIALLKKLSGNHSIIQLYDSEVALERKAIFLVMELGDVDLNNILKQQAGQDSGKNGGRPALTINFIRITWEQMLGAVHSIHEERIIHGDLKPANFLFVRGTLKLIDFGIAKAIQTDDTTNIYRDNHVGTLNYMSPEAILDTGSGGDKARMRLGRASDIWSLGCILYQMVYGQTPFANLHMIQKLHAIVNPDHKIDYPINSYVTDDRAVLDAIQLCLQRNPSKRPPIVGVNGLFNDHWFLNNRR